MSDDGFREFVELHYAALLRTGYLLTGSRDTAQDLVQNALLKALRLWQRIDEPLAYVRRILVNERISWWRRIGSREVLGSILPDRTTGRDLTDAVDARGELLAALAQLPVRMRTVLVLRYWEDLSEAETARILHCSVGTVKSHASRGLARLRDVLAPLDRSPATSIPTVGRNA